MLITVPGTKPEAAGWKNNGVNASEPWTVPNEYVCSYSSEATLSEGSGLFGTLNC